MKRLIVAAALIGSLWGDEAAKEPIPPQSAEAPSGKPLYQPVSASIDAEAQERIQQERGVIGGRGVPMHSYGETKEEPTSCGDN